MSRDKPQLRSTTTFFRYAVEVANAQGYTLPFWEHFLSKLADCPMGDPVDGIAYSIAMLIDNSDGGRRSAVYATDEEIAEWRATFPTDVQVRVDWILQRLEEIRALAPAKPRPPKPPPRPPL